MNIFEKATKIKLRFESKKGDITLEDLWDMPLISLKGFSLDDVAKNISQTLKAQETESFVTVINPITTLDTLRMDIVKHIIAIKLAENKAKKTASENKAKKARILDLIAEKKDAHLQAIPLEDLERMADEL